MQASTSMFFAFTLVLACFAPCTSAIEPYPYEPKANEAAVVVVGDARFTILTDRLIRIEYKRGSNFEDRPSIAVLNRKTEVPSFTTSTFGRTTTIDTEFLRLNYTRPSRAEGEFQGFTRDNLIITTRDGSALYPPRSRDPRKAKSFTWRFGDVDSGNLLGTVRSLDDLQYINLNCSEIEGLKIHNESLHCEYGLVSSLGWAVYNDSGSPLLKNDWPVNDMSNDEVDLYFFGYGLDFRSALKAYTRIGGKVPMLPRYGLGVMWSRWYDMDAWLTKQIIEDYRTRGIPLDIYVTDMNWHLEGWTGYTFNKRIIPFPNDTFGWIHKQGIKVAANLHDASGVQNFEECYEEMARANGIDPSTGNTVKANFTDKTYMHSLDDICWKRLPFDIPWIDWQQGGETGVYIRNVNPTIWLNHARSTNNLRWGRNERSMILARFGGMGNHRYQAGFSGDVIHTWDALAFQPYFTSTASNVLYGYWSHDILGRAHDYEMFTRAIQWGSLSPLFRTHDAGMAQGGCALVGICSIVEIWNQPKEFFEISRAALADRQRLLPYLYTLNRELYDDGVSPIRPMYYDWPLEAAAYSDRVMKKEYMLGDDILVAPITSPMNTSNKLSNWSVWLPPGTWFDRVRGKMIDSSTLRNGNYTQLYDLSEIPIFVKAGSVIPQITYDPDDVLGVAKRNYQTLHFDVYPGSGQGSRMVYEDDGESLDYMNGSYAWTTFQYRTSGNQMLVNISTKGFYKGMPSSRDYSIRLISSVPPSSVTVNGRSIGFSIFGEANSWYYDGQWVGPVVQVSNVQTSASLSIVMSFPSGSSTTSVDSVRGLIGRSWLSKIRLDHAIVSGYMKKSGQSLQEASSTGAALEHLAGSDIQQFAKAVNKLPDLVKAAVEEVRKLWPLDPSNQQNAIELLTSA
eukprot:gb/GECG01006509.1/.p1 GENE.gb/GECG01006509.1/~~gb/GECG01006509.1/.p1  ORF type:complete len:904 (+),score=86.49 gb/GECG01006509.1/:1-2712(+)